MKKAGSSKSPPLQDTSFVPGSLPASDPQPNLSPSIGKSPPDGGSGGGQTLFSPRAADKPSPQAYEATLVPPNFSISDQHYVTASLESKSNPATEGEIQRGRRRLGRLLSLLRLPA